MKQVCVKLSDEEYADFTAYAALHGRSLPALMRACTSVLLMQLQVAEADAAQRELARA